jgi:hypothetical protein
MYEGVQFQMVHAGSIAIANHGSEQLLNQREISETEATRSTATLGALFQKHFCAQGSA